MRNEDRELYTDMASRHGEYVAYVHFPDGMRYAFFKDYLDEAIQCALGAEQAEVYHLEELAPDVPALIRLAEICFGEWFIEDEEGVLTMAKVKQVAKNGSGRDVEEDLIGTTKKEKIKVGKAEKTGKKAKAGKGEKSAAGRGRAPSFTDDQKVRQLKPMKDITAREGSKLDITVKTFSKGITIGAWNKARKKGGMANPGLGLIRKLVNDGYIAVK